MSMNKYMHPRNIYKTPPDFKNLAISFPEFAEFVTVNLNGTVSLNFSNIKALRSLSKILLKKDFDLDVELPLNRLIPTIPLRLNYILWLEDILMLVGKSDNIIGIDIGTGASCVYPLIIAKKNGWNMIASEVDSDSFICAKNNVERNGFENKINIVKVESDTVLKDLVKADNYDFCMCNPPFFGSTQELDPHHNARNLNRPKPKNSFCATVEEVVVKGGEVDFISKLINESKELGTQVTVYTTMVGCKKNLPQLKSILRTVEVCSFKETEFCQGNTTRWGLAWTFSSEIDLKKCIDYSKQVPKTTKPKEPLKYVIPLEKTDEHSLNNVRNSIVKLFRDLDMVTEEVSRKKHLIRYLVSAYSNTWSNQRRKRRAKLTQSFDGLIGENNNVDNSSSIDVDVKSPGKRSNEELIEGTSLKKLRLGTDTEVFFKFMASILLEESSITLELNCTDNKDNLHQILQYIKNNLKILE